jgi:hypothetical protein
MPEQDYAQHAANDPNEDDTVVGSEGIDDVDEDDDDFDDDGDELEDEDEDEESAV